jgi:hypothetical protein
LEYSEYILLARLSHLTQGDAHLNGNRQFY